MIKTSIKYLTTLALLVACAPTQEPAMEHLSDPNNTRTKNVEQFNLQGNWILTNYYDSILKNKTISKYRLNPIAWNLMSLQFKGDTMYSYGIFAKRRKTFISGNSDSLATISSYGTHNFSYDKTKDLIIAVTVTTDSTKQYPVFYRRVTEKKLLSIVTSTDINDIEKGFYQIFIDSLIAGRYSSSENGQPMVLTQTGVVKGFKKYNFYKIHDYFGTYHPFQNNDVIIFGDSTVSVDGNGPPSKKAIGHYAWAFKGDKLFLTELETENHEQFYLGKKSYIFNRDHQQTQ